MKILRNSTVGAKIRIVLMVTFALMVVIALVGLYYINQLNTHINNLVEVAVQKIELSGHVKQGLQAINILEQDMILVATVEEQDALEQQVVELEAEINGHLVKLQEILTHDDDKTLLFQLKQAFEKAMLGHHEVRDLARANSNNESFTLNLGEEQTLAAQVDDDLADLNILLQRDLAVAERSGQFESYRDVTQKLLLLAELQQHFMEIRWREKNLILAHQEDAQIKSDIDITMEAFNQARLKLAALLKERYGNEIRDFTTHVNQWKIVHQETVALALFNSNERALQKADGEVEPALEMALDQVERIIMAADAEILADEAMALSEVNLARGMILGLTTLAIGVGIAFGAVIGRMITQPLASLVQASKRVAEGDLAQRVKVWGTDEVGVLSEAFNQMTISLEKVTSENNRQIWLTQGRENLVTHMTGLQDISALAKNTLDYICKYLEAQVGTLYLAEGDVFRLVASYAYTTRKNLANEFKLGEGLIGQAALEQQMIVLTHVPLDYIVISSSLGETPPTNILVAPFMYEDKVVGLVELGAVAPFTETHRMFIDQVVKRVGIAFYTAQARVQLGQLLADSQRQAEQLRVQEEELRASNEELETQAQSLRDSEARLREKQIELERANAELEEQTAVLEHNSAVLREKQTVLDEQNRELLVAQESLQQKAEELTLASKYKSEFLANMSHELRTPLNSLLILARMLSQNEGGHLLPDQVESAKIIFNSGQDLLNLINDILDLSKIEAGKMEFHIAPVALADLVTSLETQFRHVAEDKGLTFDIVMASDLPQGIETDKQRVGQILKNLLANAFKFTAKGGVTLQIHRPTSDIDLSRSGLKTAETVAFSVKDTGIGIPLDKQKVIFEAFQQADGSTSRQYGGTGLGLSIARELAAKLGGQIGLVSTPGQGSIFTLYLGQGKQEALPLPTYQAKNPEPLVKVTETKPPAIAPELLPVLPFADDREAIEPSDKVLLIIEDDPHFAKIVYDIARKRGFKTLVALAGQTGMQLVKQYTPTAIILDLRLPDMTGWQVLEWLKHNPDTRHIPVHIMSVDDETLEAYKRGAMGYLTKPVLPDDLEQALQKINLFTSREIKNLLLIEDESNLRQSLKKLLGGSDVTIHEASSGQAALALLRQEQFDCMILDLKLPDMSGFELLSQLNQESTVAKCPVIVYTGKALTEDENRLLMQYTDSVIVKGVKSPERLLDETALFLHRVVANMPPEKQATIKQLYNREELLTGKRVLIVDDDMRNSFALSKILSDKGMLVEIANNGQRALDLLTQKSNVDVVLMDIMMPVMDGFEAIRQIRQRPQFKTLPILALTAKAMKGDREKCLEAGANDYLPKPVDADRLFSMLRVWLYQ